MKKFNRIIVICGVFGLVVVTGLFLAKSPAQAELVQANAAETAVSTAFSYQG